LVACRVLYARGFLNANLESAISKPALFDLIRMALLETRDTGIRTYNPFPSFAEYYSRVTSEMVMDSRFQSTDQSSENFSETQQQFHFSMSLKDETPNFEVPTDSILVSVCALSRPYVSFQDCENEPIAAIFAGMKYLLIY
jgi:hypothetical protein